MTVVNRIFICDVIHTGEKLKFHWQLFGHIKVEQRVTICFLGIADDLPTIRIEPDIGSETETAATPG
jgi:hypothetical protein